MILCQSPKVLAQMLTQLGGRGEQSLRRGEATPPASPLATCPLCNLCSNRPSRREWNRETSRPVGNGRRRIGGRVKASHVKVDRPVRVGR